MTEKIIPHSSKWKKLLFSAMLDDYGDEYISCNKCSKPTHRKYICTWCGSDEH